MVDKVDIEEEEKEDERDQHSHNIKTDPTKEDDFNCAMVKEIDDNEEKREQAQCSWWYMMMSIDGLH
jgi:hypothetical protein